MSFGRYLSSHLFALICSLAVIALLALMLAPMGLGHDAVLLISISTGVLLGTAFLHDWLRERRLMSDLDALANQDLDALDMAEQLAEPDYPEGHLIVQALSSVARDSRRKTEEARAETESYRHYLEAWIHEAKTPLAAMRLFLENHPEEELALLETETDRLDRLVDQALFYARSFSVDCDYLVRACPLDEFVRRAIRSRAHQLVEAHVTVDLSGLLPNGSTTSASPASPAADATVATSASPVSAAANATVATSSAVASAAADSGSTAPAVPCDPKWMEFILGQIIDNAIRYRADPRRDGRAPQISFSVRMEQEGTARARVLLDVCDNGCGILPEDLPRVFDRGFTGSNGRTHARSTGMGLYLVRTLCEKMGLATGIASDTDAPGSPGWTCVTIAFPALKDAVSEVAGPARH